MSTSPPLLEQFVEALRCMPGIGKKSAQRIAHQLLRQQREPAKHLASVMMEAMQQIGHCEHCQTFTDTKLCHLCDDPQRDDSLLCVVESPSDVEAIEATNYRGRYFVLLGHLSPLDGIGPEDLGLNKFEFFLENSILKEVILATNTTAEGEATAHFISEMVKAHGKKVTRIAYGVPMGGELEYVNSITIAHAINERKAV